MRTLTPVFCFLLTTITTGCGVDPKTDIEPQSWWQQQLAAKGAPRLGRQRELKLWSKFITRGVVMQATRTAYPDGLRGGPEWVRAEREYRYDSECGRVTLGHRTVIYRQGNFYGVMHRDDEASSDAEPEFTVNITIGNVLYDFGIVAGQVLAHPLPSSTARQLYLRWDNAEPDAELLKLEAAYEGSLHCLEQN